MSESKKKTKIKTASWYIPWNYRIYDGFDGFRVQMTNGAGQRAGVTAPFPTRDDAHDWIIEHATERAKEMNALVN